MGLTVSHSVHSKRLDVVDAPLKPPDRQVDLVGRPELGDLRRKMGAAWHPGQCTLVAMESRPVGQQDLATVRNGNQERGSDGGTVEPVTAWPRMTLSVRYDEAHA